MKPAILASILALTIALSPVTARAEDQVMLQDAEQQAMADTLQHALEMNETNESSAWVNPDTGRSGTTAPIRTFYSEAGTPCREYITTIVIGGREEQGYGIACRQPDGSWELAPEAKPAQQVLRTPPPPAAYNVPPPERYYVYPSGFYGPSRIFLSFDYVFRGGRLHYGTYYLDGPTFYRRHHHPIRERVYIGPRFIDRYRIRDEWRYRDWERKRHWKDDRLERRRSYKIRTHGWERERREYRRERHEDWREERRERREDWRDDRRDRREDWQEERRDRREDRREDRSERRRDD